MDTILFLLITDCDDILALLGGKLCALGSFAVGAQVLFFAAIALLSYKLFHLDLKNTEKREWPWACAPAILLRYLWPILVLSNPDPGVFVMIVLVVPLALKLLVLIAARIFAKDVE